MSGIDFDSDEGLVAIGRPNISEREWMKGHKFVRVTAETMAACIDACLASPSKKFALDLETSGLDNRVIFPHGRYGNGKGGRTCDSIVGVCLSPDGVTGYYIPLRHKRGTEHNVPWSLFETEFKRLMDAMQAGELVAIFHNGIFDQEFLEFNGGEPLGDWDSPSRWEDTLIQAYLLDSRRKAKGLKVLSKDELKIDQIELDELFTEDSKKVSGFRPDFSELDPSWDPVIWYGAADAICTYKLDDLFRPRILANESDGKNLRTIYQVEKLCVTSTRWMMRCRIKVDRAKVMDLIKIGQKEWFGAVFEVYAEAEKLLGRDVMPGYYKVIRDRFVSDDEHNLLPEQIELAKAQQDRLYPNPKGHLKKRVQTPDGKKEIDFPIIYDINAAAQLGEMFQEMEVPGLIFTEKSGQVKTSKDVLDQVIEDAGEKFPFMGKVKRFREISKALSSYLIPMLRDTDRTDSTMRINFNPHKVDTGRFSTPARENAEVINGWPAINLQSLPATYDPNRPECMTRIRECVIARHKGWKVVAIDFSGVELRLVTNLSREPRWIEEFFRCSTCSRTFSQGDGLSTPLPPPPRCPNCGSDKIGDLHTLTALSVYGQDAGNKPEWKQLRQNAKSTNFALCYGGGGTAVVRACKGQIDKNEGWRIKEVFDKSYSGLRGWWEIMHQFGRKHLFVRTPFGRKCSVEDIIMQDGGFRSKAERNAVNFPIQGSSADVTKIAMGLIYKEIKKRGWWDKVYMIVTMHDELVFEIEDSILEEAIEVLKHTMTRNKFLLGMKWPIPLTSDVEIGYDWSVPWDINGMRAQEYRFKGNKKLKNKDKAAEQGLDWNALPWFPDDLAPCFNFKTFEGLNAAIDAWVEGQAVVPSTVVMPGPFGDTGTPPAITPVASEVGVGAPAGMPTINTPVQLPKLSPGEVFCYTFKARRSLGNLSKLAQVILECRNRGSKPLKIVLPDGSELTGWNPFGGEIYVHEEEFAIRAQIAGL